MVRNSYSTVGMTSFYSKTSGTSTGRLNGWELGSSEDEWDHKTASELTLIT